MLGSDLRRQTRSHVNTSSGHPTLTAKKHNGRIQFDNTTFEEFPALRDEREPPTVDGLRYEDPDAPPPPPEQEVGARSTIFHHQNFPKKGEKGHEPDREVDDDSIFKDFPKKKGHVPEVPVVKGLPFESPEKEEVKKKAVCIIFLKHFLRFCCDVHELVLFIVAEFC